MKKLDATLAELRQAAEKHDGVVVAYSGGKDSMTVMDLCLRSFKRVEAFHMYFAPDVPSDARMRELCVERFGVKVREYPHWASIRALQSLAYVDPQPAIDMLPQWELRDIYQLALDDTGCKFVAVGAKKADGAWRRRFMKGTEAWTFLLNPIAEWNKFDVLGYVQARNLPIRTMRQGKTATGEGLTFSELHLMHDTAPEDFAAMLDIYPYAEAPIYHRQFFGVTADGADAG